MLSAEVANAMHAEALRLIKSDSPAGAVVLLSALDFFAPGHIAVRGALGAAHYALARKHLAAGHIDASIASLNHSLSMMGTPNDVHADLAKALRRVTGLQSWTLLLEGGIGDFLQCIPFLRTCGDDAPQILVLTHFKDAPSFFAGVGTDISELHYFSNLEELGRAHVAISKKELFSRCPRQQYFDQPPFPKSLVVFPHNRPVLGMQLGGSAFSLKVQRQWGVVTKELPVAVLNSFLSTNHFNIILFGSRSEIDSLAISENDSLRFACHPDITKSLALAAQCDAFVGSDSAVKTMTSMLRIPTIVWLGDYPDPIRDSVFIDPYVRDGVMRVFKFKSWPADIATGVQVTLEALAQFGVPPRGA